MSVAQQALSLFAADRGYMGDVEVDKILAFEEALHGYLTSEKAELEQQINTTGDLTKRDVSRVIDALKLGEPQ